MIDLDRILDGLVADVEPFALCEVRGGGGIDMGCQDRATLHYVIAGSGIFRMAGWPALPVTEGTVLLTPAALAHRLTAGEGHVSDLPHCMPLGEDWAHMKSGGGDGGVLVACGRIRASYQNVEGVFDFLHEPVVADLREDRRLRQSVESLIDELAAPQPGTRLVARALMQQCLVLLLRRPAAEGHGDLQWLAAARDERLWAAVSAMFNNPAAPYTLENLAQKANMSRSTFAEHFSAVFGRGPIDVLKEMRLHQAARLLLTTDGSVKKIAGQVGYASRSYFTRAFTASFGVSPARYRADYQTQPADDRS